MRVRWRGKLNGGKSHRASDTLCQSRRKKGKMTNIFLMDSDEGVIVERIKDYE